MHFHLQLKSSASILLLFLSAAFDSIYAQQFQGSRLSTRTCTASAAVIAGRAVGASNANANAACSTYCSTSNPQAGTGLWIFYCGVTVFSSGAATGTVTYTASGNCGVTSYFYNAPLINGGQTVVPTLTNTGANTVNVPCGYAGTPITAAQLNFSSPGSTTPYYVNQQVIASSPTDNRVGYVSVSSTGALSTGSLITPPQDVTQTIRFTLSQRGTAVYSNSVDITFVFKSCQLQLSGPSGPVNVCNGNVPFTGPTFFPQLTFTVTNAPAGLALGCDIPGNQGTGTSENSQKQTGTPLSSPAIILDQTIDPDPGNTIPAPFINEQASFTPGYNNLFVLNYNTQANPPPAGNVCVYGANTGNAALVTGCQQLRFSVAPQPTAGTSTPYLTGFKVVQVCYVNC